MNLCPICNPSLPVGRQNRPASWDSRQLPQNFLNFFYPHRDQGKRQRGPPCKRFHNETRFARHAAHEEACDIAPQDQGDADTTGTDDREARAGPGAARCLTTGQCEQFRTLGGAMPDIDTHSRERRA